jgi:alpha-beta hydrolase superfamily lysophospholipase
MYSSFDVRPVLSRLFYPRRDRLGTSANGAEWTIPVAEGISLGARWFDAGPSSAALLFFHGNGEIADDYADLGPLFVQRGLSLLVADYRGYGWSGGTPTVAAMMADSHAVFEHLSHWLERRERTGPVLVMGRSLGSAPAVELAGALGFPRVAGLVVESGFARAKPLLRTLGVGEGDIKRLAGEGMDNVHTIRRYAGPTLVIHGALDHLIPVGDGQALYEASPAESKQMLVVPRADHNSLFQYGLENYLEAVARLARDCLPSVEV